MLSFWIYVLFIICFAVFMFQAFDAIFTPHIGRNHYGKYKIKKVDFRGKIYYVPKCVYVKYFGIIPVYSSWMCQTKNNTQLDDEIYGWINKMECIEDIEKDYYNYSTRKKLRKEI